MQLKLSYTEISDLVKRKTDKTIMFCYGGDHTVRIGYDVTVMFKSSQVGIDVTVQKIEGSDIYVSFSGGSGIEFMLRQALKMAPHNDAIEMRDGCTIVAHLDKNPQMQPLVQNITLHDIHFDGQSVMVDFTPNTMQ